MNNISRTQTVATGYRVRVESAFFIRARVTLSDLSVLRDTPSRDGDQLWLDFRRKDGQQFTQLGDFWE